MVDLLLDLEVRNNTNELDGFGAVPKPATSTSPFSNPNRNYSTPADKPDEPLETAVCNPESPRYNKEQCEARKKMNEELNKPKFFRDFTLVLFQTIGIVGNASNAPKITELSEDINWEQFITRMSIADQKAYCEKYPNSQNCKRLKSYKTGAWATIGGVTLLTIGGIVYAVRKGRDTEKEESLKGYASKGVVYAVGNTETATANIKGLKGYIPNPKK